VGSNDSEDIPRIPTPGKIIYDDLHELNPSLVHRPRPEKVDLEESVSDLIFSTTMASDYKGKEVDRGRTIERRHRYTNPLAQAESRSRRNEPAIEVDVRPIEQRKLSRSRTFSNFEDPTDPCAILEDNMMEPCPHASFCSTVSEVLNTTSTSPGTARPHTAGPNAHDRFGNVTNISKRRRTTPPKPSSGIITCTSYPSPMDTTPPPIFPKSQLPDHATSLTAQLPTEILQQVFNMLAPSDFNSARHTCRSWYISSLERSILKGILRRGGWHSSIQRDMAANHTSPYRMSDEWLMSKRIARECALGPDFTGNGLVKDEGDEPSSLLRSSFIHTSTVDFTEVATHYPGKNTAGIIFTISSCGRFLMVANGCLIYVYELNRSSSEDVSTSHPGSLRPVTSVICPRRVLACSMDTSSGRYAIAVLLDGRMGFVCDISPANINAARHISNDTAHRNNVFEAKNLQTAGSSQSPSFLDRVSLNNSGSNLTSARSTSQPPFVFPGIAATPTSLPDDWEQHILRGDNSDSANTAEPSSQHAPLPRAYTLGAESRLHSILPSCQETPYSTNTMPVEIGPRSLYRNLCSDDDPPRSVAICPQRRCVAFGCSAGIELHWVDALTGQDLNRWFPLTAPSDYLFFLPPRKSVDSAKKLRLISSAARPGERAAISERAFGRSARNSPFWQKLNSGGYDQRQSETTSDQGYVSRMRGGNSSSRGYITGKMDCSDHYRAVPLSDGYHILFTDPTTGLLCLGSDAPVGGPTKLLRKIWFEGPEGEGSPVAYAGGADLSWGVRVVAAFGSGQDQKIWFYSVPGDVFAANQGSQIFLGGSYLQAGSAEKRNRDWVEWWPNDGLHEWLNHSKDPIPGVLPKSIWPIKIRGQQIGICPELVDLTVDSEPAMTVWAFSKAGVATIWKLDDGMHEGVKKKCVVVDGTIRQIDGDGDTEMCDVLQHPNHLDAPLPLTQESFDGTASVTRPEIAMAQSLRFGHVLQRIHHCVKYVSDGVLFQEALDSEIHHSFLQDALDHVIHPSFSEDSFEAVAFAHHRNGNLYRTSRGDDGWHARVEAEEGGYPGITRVEIEIR
jgi:hypothetical protein